MGLTPSREAYLRTEIRRLESAVQLLKDELRDRDVRIAGLESMIQRQDHRLRRIRSNVASEIEDIKSNLLGLSEGLNESPPASTAA